MSAKSPLSPSTVGKLSVPVYFSPLLFLVLRIFNDSSVRISLCLLVLAIVFTLYIVKFKLYLNYRQLIIFLMISPIFTSVCLGFSDFSFFTERSLVAAFTELSSPSLMHPFGTDFTGRDIFSALVVGGFNLYFIVGIATVVSVIFGVLMAVSLNAKLTIFKKSAEVVTQLFEVIPQLFFVLIVLGVYNFWAALNPNSSVIAYLSIPIVSVAIGLSSLPNVARVLQNRISTLDQSRFVQVLKSSNVNEKRILFYNIIWKNSLSEIAVQASFIAGSVVLLESAISYIFQVGFGDLGGGGYLSWGRLLAEARQSLLFGDDVQVVIYPILITISTILGANLLGDMLAKSLKK